MTLLSNFYDMSRYEWALTLKGQTQIYGFFVSFIVDCPNKKMNNKHYPVAIQKDFAFCPRPFCNEFNDLMDKFKGVLNDSPNYIKFFDINEIQHLQLLISH